jgi:murein DD-endopeptidase MepM/ murein hydrolase activator NlpD
MNVSMPPSEFPPTLLLPTITPASTSIVPAQFQPALGSPTEQGNAPLISPTPTFEPSATPPPFQLCSPLAEHTLEELPEIISDPYHPPPPGKEERHQGVDFSYYRRGDRMSIQGVPVQSILSGVAAASLEDKFPYGNMVIVETPIEDLPADLAERLDYSPGESLYILYVHMEQAPEVALGEAVNACQGLGSVGKSGNAGVTHLHIETRIGPAGQQFPSMAYYDLKASEEEKAAYLRWRISWDFRHFDPMVLLTFTPAVK